MLLTGMATFATVLGHIPCVIQDRSPIDCDALTLSARPFQSFARPGGGGVTGPDAKNQGYH